MKKFFIALLILFAMQFTYADDAANIKIRMTGAMNDNSYFLCLPNIGCLSILAGNKGKVYPVFHSFTLSNIYITNVDDRFRVSDQGLPASCNITVNTNQTLVVHGHIEKIANNIYVRNLHCTIS